MRRLDYQLLLFFLSLIISTSALINPFHALTKYQLDSKKTANNTTVDSRQAVRSRFVAMANVRLGEPKKTTTATLSPSKEKWEDSKVAQKIVDRMQNIGQLKGWLERRGPQVIRFGKRSYYDDIDYYY
uniref:RxLR effector protein n=1 Tax=Plectus sambesii TaxID=2011161 RepID=A0A914WTK9_9BILA